MKRVRLSEVIKIMESGGRPKGGASNISTGVPSIGGEHIERDGTINFQNKRYIPNDYFKTMKRGHISHNDILIVKDGATTGKVAYVDSVFPQPAAINEHVFRLTVNSDKVLPRYVFYHLLSSLGNRQILKDFRGSTVGGISQDFPEKVEFCLPEMAKQKIVVKALDRAKQLFRTRYLALDICDSIPQSFFFHMFGDPKRNTRDWGQKILGDELDCIESGSSPVCEGQRLNSNE